MVIPIFTPEKACPYRCIYCNQYNIANRTQSPEPEEVKATIDKYLTTGMEKSIKRVAFFGGSFTGMPISEQKHYLSVVQPYIARGEIDSIQLSTRPDYINKEILQMLKEHHVSIIELGAQSLDEEILKRSGRGHTVHDVEKAAYQIKEQGFLLGLQMMIGLPGDSLEKSIATAQKIVELQADNTRIYPTLVIKDTDLEDLYHKGLYTPLTIEQAKIWSIELLKIFNHNNIHILRIGLHPSEGLINGNNLVAGPFHVSFKELVLTDYFNEMINSYLENNNISLEDHLLIKAHPKMMNAVIGYHGKNKEMLSKKSRHLSFQKSLDTPLYDCQIEIQTIDCQ